MGFCIIVLISEIYIIVLNKWGFYIIALNSEICIIALYWYKIIILIKKRDIKESL